MLHALLLSVKSCDKTLIIIIIALRHAKFLVYFADERDPYIFGLRTEDILSV